MALELVTLSYLLWQCLADHTGQIPVKVVNTISRLLSKRATRTLLDNFSMVMSGQAPSQNRSFSNHQICQNDRVQGTQGTLTHSTLVLIMGWSALLPTLNHYMIVITYSSVQQVDNRYTPTGIGTRAHCILSLVVKHG